ncbi:MAG: hypothetical protein AUJ75_01250, partial [Candidatus Omnitrophica bacterium CG1_02_49_10]
EVGDINLLPVSGDDVSSVVLDYENTINSPKEFFHPDSEALFRFTGASHDDADMVYVAEEIVLFGVRPCDTAALGYLDKVFSGDFEDELYLKRRDKSVVITLGCTECHNGCFCTSTGTGPFLESGFDIQLVPVATRYVVYTGSDKGSAFIERYGKYFKSAKAVDKRDAELAVLKAAKCPPKFSSDKVYDRLSSGKVHGDLWKDVASRCQSCGSCLFICPTCYCFTVYDNERPDGEKTRCRQWDACYFRGFTRMAGGADPVGSGEGMAKRKYNHKLWHDKDRFGISGCVGCGRCNESCVGNVNWLENIIRIEKS